MPHLVDIERLQTVNNYAAQYKGRKKVGVSVGYIYQLINEKKLDSIEIDGIKFIVLPPAPAT